MGKLTLLLLVLLGWLQYSLWLGKNGVHDFVRVKDDVELQQANNAKLKSRNDQLFAEIDDLNGGLESTNADTSTTREKNISRLL